MEKKFYNKESCGISENDYIERDYELEKTSSLTKDMNMIPVFVRTQNIVGPTITKRGINIMNCHESVSHKDYWGILSHESPNKRCSDCSPVLVDEQTLSCSPMLVDEQALSCSPVLVDEQASSRSSTTI